MEHLRPSRTLLKVETWHNGMEESKNGANHLFNLPGSLCRLYGQYPLPFIINYFVQHAKYHCEIYISPNAYQL
jgi:hypothetical protein